MKEPTPELTEAVCKSVRLGNHIEVAAAAHGVPRRTLTKWLAAGHAEESGAHQAFADAVLAAESSCEQRVVHGLMQMLESWPQGALQFLERRYPDRWGKGSEVASVKRAEAAGKEAPTVEISAAVLADLLRRQGYEVTAPKATGEKRDE